MALGSLVSGGHFLVIAGEEGGAWVEAARKLAAAKKLPVKAFTIGLGDCDYVDVRLAWLKHRGIGPQGVVIVRPDHYVAFRAQAASEDPHAALAGAFDAILSHA